MFDNSVCKAIKIEYLSSKLMALNSFNKDFCKGDLLKDKLKTLSNCLTPKMSYVAKPVYIQNGFYNNCQNHELGKISIPVSSWAQAVVIALVILLVLFPSMALAAQGNISSSNSNFSLEQVLKTFESQILSMRHTIYLFSNNLILYFGIFAISCRGIYLILKQGTLVTFTFEFVKLIFIFGLVRFFLLNGYDFATDLINSLLTLVNGNSNIGTPTTQSLNDFFEFLSDFARTLAPNNAIFFVVFMVLMYVAISFLFLLYIIRYLSVLFILVFGSVSIAFAIFKPTRFIVFNFLALSLGSALKFVALCFVIRIGQEILVAMINSMRVDIMMGFTISLQDAGFVLLICFLICSAAFYLPILLSRVCSPMLAIQSPIRC